MKRVVAALRSPLVRWLFLAVALGLAVFAVWVNWDALVEASQRLSALTILGAAVASVVYVALTLLSWKRILADLGSDLSAGGATALFGVSQIGKYVPGGVWNIVAAAELGADQDIPRRRSVTAMTVAILVSLVSGVVVGCAAFVVAPADALGGWGWLVWVVPFSIVALFPPVTNAFISWVFRVTKREPLEHPLTTRGLAVSVAWSLAAWAVAGVQVWVLATGLGMPLSASTLALAVGGYALAWVVGFLVVFVPAGAGAREVVLLAVLGGSLATGSVLLVVLMSRALLTVVDLALAGLGLVIARRIRRRPEAGRASQTERAADERRLES